MEEERDGLRALFDETQTDASRLRSRLDVCTDTIAMLRNEVDEQHAAAARRHAGESAAASTALALQQAQVALDASEARAAAAQQQLDAVLGALDRERAQSELALAVLQQRRDERERQLEGQLRHRIERLEHKYRDAKIRLKEYSAWREAAEPPRAELPAAPPADAVGAMHEQLQAALMLLPRRTEL